MSNLELISKLNYVLGRFEGVGYAVNENAQEALLDTCDLLKDIIETKTNELSIEMADADIDV